MIILPLSTPNPTWAFSHIELTASFLSYLHLISLFCINHCFDQPFWTNTMSFYHTSFHRELYITSLGWHLLTLILVVASFVMRQIKLGWIRHQISYLWSYNIKQWNIFSCIRKYLTFSLRMLFIHWAFSNSVLRNNISNSQIVWNKDNLFKKKRKKQMLVTR